MKLSLLIYLRYRDHRGLGSRIEGSSKTQGGYWKKASLEW